MTTVLIADDQEEVRQVLAAHIAAEPRLRVVGLAADAEEAIQLACEHLPDVALLDAKMPNGGGIRATREIRQRSPTTRVVIFSAYDDRASIFQLLEAGASGYLVKGARGSEICAALLGVAGGEGALSPSVTAAVVHEFAEQLGERSKLAGEHGRLVARIRRALEADVLSMAFQPIVSLAGLQTVGYEALARFDLEPRRPPNEWFAEAAVVGLGLELELAAVRLAVAELPAIPDPLFLCVNASPTALVSDELAALLADVPCERLVFEATEHAPVEDYRAMDAALAALRRRGCRLAVDDAGAGFASLRHVLQLAPEFLKIDGSLTREIESSRGARAVVSALLAFASEMEQRVIAEGIENAQMVYVLEALGARYGQGYLLGRPGPLPPP